MSEIADLFARDPLKLTKDDRTAIIAHMRANRAAFMAGSTQAGKPPKPKVEKLAKKDNLSIDDLFD